VVAGLEELAGAEIDHVAALRVTTDVERCGDGLPRAVAVLGDEQRRPGVRNAPVARRGVRDVELPKVAEQIAGVDRLNRPRAVSQQRGSRETVRGGRRARARVDLRK